MNNNTEQKKKFEFCLSFINSTDTLPDCVKHLIINVCHTPIETTIYDAIIAKIDKKVSSDEEYFPACAELYALQRNLNKKLGRVVYDRNVPDNYLLSCIVGEIVRRRPELEEKYSGEKNREAREKFKKDIFNQFKTTRPEYIDYSTSCDSLIEAVTNHYKEQECLNYNDLLKFMKSCIHDYNSKKTQAKLKITFFQYWEQCMKSREPKLVHSENDLKTQLDVTWAISLRKRLPRDKNELYMLCIAIGADINQFEIIRKLVQLESPDPNLYSNCDINDRDAKIQSVLMDIEGWIKCARIQNPLAIPKQLISDVNDMLHRSGFNDLFGKPSSCNNDITDTCDEAIDLK